MKKAGKQFGETMRGNGSLASRNGANNREGTDTKLQSKTNKWYIGDV